MINPLGSSGQRFLLDLRRTERRADQAQQQISSGYRISKASDDAQQLRPLLLARQGYATAVQHKSNLTVVKAEVDTAEDALRTAVDAMQQARVAGAQGASTLTPTSTRLVLAQQVESALQNVFRTTTSQVEGRQLFSGDADSTPPFSLNLANATPLSAYAGASTLREIPHPDGGTFKIGQTGDVIFKNADPARDVLGSLLNLRAALLADDPAAVGVAMEQIESASAHLNDQRAIYGNYQKQVDSALTSAHAAEIRYQKQMSEIEDADPVSAALELRDLKTQREASLAVQAQSPKGSLFDYLG